MNAAATATVLGYVPGATATQPAGCTNPSASSPLIVVTGNKVFANPSASTPNSGVCNISGYNWDWGDGETRRRHRDGRRTHVRQRRHLHRHPRGHQPGEAPHTASHNVTVPAPAPRRRPRRPLARRRHRPRRRPRPLPDGDTDRDAHADACACTLPTANFTWTSSGKTYTYRDASTVADPVHCPITDWLWTFTDLRRHAVQRPESRLRHVRQQQQPPA